MRRSRWLPFLAIGAFLSPLLPELLGTRLLVFRDAFVTHFPIKVYALAAQRAGAIPFLNLGASNVEPLLPDPNTVLLYPTHLLYDLFPPATAFNLHLLLHVVWAFLGAAALARRFGVPRSRSWIGGAVYAFSGPYLSYASAFTNSAAAAAWAPWAISSAIRACQARERGKRGRAALALGIALGLQLLAGEPAISAWTGLCCAIPFASMLLRRERRAVGASLLLGGGAFVTALAIAAPQLLATAAAVPYSFRGEHLFSRAQFGAAANVPIRALETLLPLVFGSPRPMVSGAFWAYRLFDSLQPYLYSLNLGLPAAVLFFSAWALPGFRRRRAVLAIAGLSSFFLLLSFGFGTPLFELIYSLKPLRHFRYPIKFMVPVALGFSVLASLAAHEWSRTGRRAVLDFGVALAAGSLLMCACLVRFEPSWISRTLAGQFRNLKVDANAVLPGIFHQVLWDALLGILSLLLVAAAIRRTAPAREALLLSAVLAALLPAGWKLFVSIPTLPYVASPPLAGALGRPGRIWVHTYPDFAVVRWGTNHFYRRDDIGDLILTGRRELWPLTGLPEGLRYSYDEDPDGSYGFLDRVMREAIEAKTGAPRARLLRAASVVFSLSDSPALLDGFRPKVASINSGHTVYLSEALRPVPIVRAATRIFRRSSLSGAIELIQSPRFDPETDAILRGPDRDPSSRPPAENRVSAIRLSAGGFSADVEASAPSVAVFAATYFRYWRAAVDGARADVEIANGAFCGVRVPPGRHRVELVYDTRPFLAGCVATATFLLASLILAPALAFRRRRRRSPPAREA